jgi:pyrimidine-specific ribonucleoside hydrolase
MGSVRCPLSYRAVALGVLAGAVTVVGCGSDGSTKETTSPTRTAIVVDTDAGLDDAIAILYLATSPDVDLRAVTVSGTGLAHCFPGANNVVGLLELAGRPEVPVSCGPEEPLGAGDPFHPFPYEWRRVADGRYGDAWRIGRGGVDDRSAPQLLTEAVRSSEAPVTLVTLGPLTNVAAALALDDRFATGLQRVVTMGGAFDVPGNTANADPPPARDVAEWNIYADPQSSREVVDAELPLRFVPLDATNDVPLDAYVLRAAARSPATEAMAVVTTLLSGVHGMVSAGAYYLWDPLAAVLAVRPELGTLETRGVDVVTSGAEAGRTVTQDGGGGAPAEIFTGANGRAAEAALLSGLTSSPMVSIDERPDVVIDPSECSAAHARLRAGPLVVTVATESAPDDTGGAVIGVLDPGRGAADIEDFFATSATEPPDWFTLTAALGAGIGGPSTDLVRVDSGNYTVVCVRGEADDLELEGINTFTVR